MKGYFLVATLSLLIAVAFAPKAYAGVVGDPLNNLVCPADMSEAQCKAAGYGDGTSTGGGGGGSCGSVNSYESCMSSCACQYNNNIKNKCGRSASLQCRSFYTSERHACEGHCITDWY